MAHQSCSLWDLEDVGENWKNADIELMVPCIAIPTTAGTGSEVGRAALIVHEEQQRKIIIFHARMLPDRVILDPDLTLGLPASLTAATGMDALSHNLEAYCSPLYHPMAAGIAVEGMRLIHRFLPEAVADGGNADARLNMLVASTMGATAFQKGLGAMHALAHPLGAVYDAHHGMLNAVLMPYVLMRNRAALADKMDVLARSLGLAPGFDGFVDWVLQLRETIGIPHSLNDILQADEHFIRIGEMAAADPSAATNPIALTAQDYQHLAEAALTGNLS
jgi:alcohol dehydrogenase class IV